MTKRLEVTRWRGPWKFDDRAWFLQGSDSETDRTKEVAVTITIDGRGVSRALARRISDFLKGEVGHGRS